MAAISIPRHVVDRVIGRRGRLHAYEHLDAGRTALVVVDMQVHFLSQGSPSEMPSAREIVPTINRLAQTLRERGGHVVWIVSTYGPDDADRWSNLFDHVLGEEAGRLFREGLTEGSDGHAIWPELEVRPEDPIVSKNRFGGFVGSAGRLEQVLRELGVDTVLITGTVTNVCCESTARESATFNFKTVMVSDANGGRSVEEDTQTYAVFVAAYGDVMSTDEVIERLEAG